MSSHVKKALISLLVVGFISFQSLSAFGQVADQAPPDVLAQQPQPPMENVFFNVLWGSLTGGMLMMGWATLDDEKPSDERYTTNNMTKQFLSGATYGGILGLLAGVYFSFQGITFDENRTKIAVFQPPRKDYFPSAKFSKQKEGTSPQEMSLVDFQYEF
jgi:hypothetical protein